MFLMLAIGIPIFFILGGAMLAFVFSSESFEPTEDTASQKISKKPVPVQEIKPLVFFQPLGWSNKMKQVPIEEIVSNIEAHLRNERITAAAFAKDPSYHKLWSNSLVS